MKDKKEMSRLALDRVSLSYGELSIIENLSLSVAPGEFVALVGPSGCGKTTLLKLLSGHIRPDAGTVGQTGIIRSVYQQDSLFPWLTVSENIRMGLGKAGQAEQEQQLRELLALIHLQGFENHYPHQLSGGMRQRVELARVLAGDSDILLMDEPFCSLDYQTRLRMRRELTRLLAIRPRTVVFVTHDIEEAVLLADRVLVLSSRPASVTCELLMDAPHPRELACLPVIEAMQLILSELGLRASANPCVSDYGV